MSSRTHLQQLAAVALGVPDVLGWVQRRRDEGGTLEAIAADLSTALGQSVSRETVRQWAGAERKAAAK